MIRCIHVSVYKEVINIRCADATFIFYQIHLACHWVKKQIR